MLEAVKNIDVSVLTAFQQADTPSWLDSIMIAVSRMGDGALFWIVITVVLCIIPRTRMLGMAAALALLSAILLGDVLIKNLLAKPRPITDFPDLQLLIETPSQYSLPSGHTMQAFAVATVLAFTVKKKSIVFIVLAFLIGFSRIYLGVHYLSDVVVGTILGVGCGVLGHFTAKPLWEFTEKLSSRKKNKKDED